METATTSTNRLSENTSATSLIDKTLERLAGRCSGEQIMQFVDRRLGALLRVTGVEFSAANSGAAQPRLNFSLAGLSETSKQSVTQSIEAVLGDMLAELEANTVSARKQEKHKLVLVDRAATPAPQEGRLQADSPSVGADINKSVAAALTHKLNNFLTAMMSAAEQLLEITPCPPDSDQAVLTGIILRASRAQQLLVDRFQKVFGPIQLHNEKCNLHQCFRSILGRLQEAHHREITYHGESTQICGITDRTLLEQMVSELVMNAIETTSEGPVDFKWQIIRSRLVLTVKNGIVEPCDEMYAKVFEPFFTTKPGHAGLGLNIARRSAEALGGTIRPIITPEQIAFAVAFPIQLEDQTNSHTERNN